jgi:uncharacterized membrane protein YbhN (UPF0104 family)
MRVCGEKDKMAQKHLVFAIRIVLTVLILALLIRAIGWQRIRPALEETQFRWLFVMYFMSLCAMIANASMTRSLLARVHLRVTLRRVMLANALSTFYTLILPGDVLAGIAKWADLSAATGDKPRVLSTLVFSKIALALPPLVIGTAALALQNPLESIRLPIAAGVLTVAIVVGSALLLNPKTGRVFDDIVLRLARITPQFIQTRIQSVLTALNEFRGLRISDHLIVYSLSLCAFFLGIAGFASAAAAAGVVIPVATLLWVAMILFVTRLLPITLSNLGIREGVVIASFGLFGVAPASALLVGLILFTNTIVIAFFGAAYQMAVANGWVEWRPSQ